MQLWAILYLLIILLQDATPSKILIYIPMPFYSHQALYRPLWKELANRGHQLTFITLNPMEPHENITQIDLGNTYKILEEQKFSELMSTGEQTLTNVIEFFKITLATPEIEFNLPEMQEFMRRKNSFDLVITEFYLPAGAGFAYKFGCPLIGFVSMDVHCDIHNILGNPTHPVLYPSVDLGFPGKLNFKQRLISFIFYGGWQLFSQYYGYLVNNVIQKNFGPEAPDYKDLLKNSSMFVNLNPVFHNTRPLNSWTINVGGGLHIEPPKPLPSDIQDFLDNSKEGVIYFSLGSSIRSSQLSQKSKTVILETFSQLPYKVLWKFEKEYNETLEIPNNTFTKKWLPQQDVLRHPNIKLFITQGGLQSLEEALFIGVPVLAMPFFGDQFFNSQRVVSNGFGLSLDHKTMDVSQFKNTILELIESPRYKDSAIRLAKQLSDQPMTGVERAAEWVEYILRNKNLDILKPATFDLPLYQYFFLDIILFCLCMCIVMFYLVLTIFRCIKVVLGFSMRKSKRD